MKTSYTILRIGLLAISLIVLSGCATKGGASNQDNSKFNALRGSETTYGDTESIASGGATSNEEAHAKAQLALSQKDIDQALYYYVKALEFKPKDITALLALARLHSSLGNIDPTIFAYRLILEQDPNHIEAMEGAGLTLLKVNRANEAKTMLDRVYKLAPNRPMTIMGIAVYYDLIKDFDHANEYYQNAVKIAPTSVKILNNYAYSRFLAGDLDESENVYKKLLKQAPNHKQAILNYGLLQARVGKTTEALQSLRKVISEPEAYNELGYICMMQQDYGKARRLFELAISSSPTYFDRASKNLEQLKLLVSRLTKTGTKNRTINNDTELADGEKITKQSLNSLLTEWMASYAGGETDKILILLTSDADVNGMVGTDAIRKYFNDLFSGDTKHDFFIDDIQWKIAESQGTGDGSYEIREVVNGNRKITKGTIRITAILKNDNLLITNLYLRENKV